MARFLFLVPFAFSILWPGSAPAAVDIVRITVEEASFTIDHPSQQTGDQYSVRMHCIDGVNNPVVVTNKTEHEILVTSLVGLARLSSASTFGAHSATFRSLPRDVLALTVSNPRAHFALVCEP
jgi:hypothetical protein